MDQVIENVTSSLDDHPDLTGKRVVSELEWSKLQEEVIIHFFGCSPVLFLTFTSQYSVRIQGCSSVQPDCLVPVRYKKRSVLLQLVAFHKQ